MLSDVAVVGTFVAVIFNCSLRLQSILHLPARLWPRVRHVPARNLRRQRHGACSCQRQIAIFDTWPRLSNCLKAATINLLFPDIWHCHPSSPHPCRFDALCNSNTNIFHQINMHTIPHTHAARRIYLSAICNQSRNYCGDSGTHNVIKANAKFFLEIKFVLVFQCTSVLPLATLSYCMDKPIDSHFHAKLLNVLQSIYYLNFHGHQSQPLQLESWIPWITCDLLHCCHSWWTFTQLSALIS